MGVQYPSNENTTLICNQMWPDDMWPEIMWTDGMWPEICEIIVQHRGCIYDLGTNLINELDLETEIINSNQYVLDLNTGDFVSLNLIGDNSFILNILQNKDIKTSFVNASDYDINFIQNRDFKVEMGDWTQSLDFIESKVMSLIIMDDTHLDVDLITGYNIQIDICYNGDCNCG